MSLRKEVPGRMPISAENDDCPPLGNRASSPGSERAAEAKKSRQHETPEVTVLEFEQELAVQEYEQRLAMEHEQRLAVLEYEQRLEDRVQQQQRLEDRLQQQQQRLDVLENALAKCRSAWNALSATKSCTSRQPWCRASTAFAAHAFETLKEVLSSA